MSTEANTVESKSKVLREKKPAQDKSKVEREEVTVTLFESDIQEIVDELRFNSEANRRGVLDYVAAYNRLSSIIANKLR